MAKFSVILPHRRNPGNDAALLICLECLFENTTNDFKLIMDAAVNSPLFPRVNKMFYQADTDICVYLASDTFVAPGWDKAMLEMYTPDRIVTGVLIEPGVMGIHPQNHEHDFGRRPETFDRAAFEKFVAQPDAPFPSGIGFPCPYMISRTGFWQHGGLEENLEGDHQGFAPADLRLFERWRESGREIVRASSYAYHIQRYSELDNQNANNRDVRG